MDDSIEARISSECPVETQAILRAAWRHDLPAIKPLLSAPGKASCSDPITGETPLHAAIRSLGPVTESDEPEKDEAETEAVKTVEHLLLYGAIWNDVDDSNETPGCVAWRLGRKAVYEVMVRAGMRAEMLFAILDGYEALGSEGGEDDDEVEAEVEAEAEEEDEAKAEADANAEDITATDAEPASEDAPYLESKLTLVDGKLVDAAGNGVMMAWEKDIMRRSVDAMLGDGAAAEGKRVLNIGFGLGIIDSMIAATQPARHHIIEAHPEVLARIDAASASASGAGAAAATTTTGGSDDHAGEFGAAWEATSTVEPGAYKIQRGRWQDICPKLLAEGELYDAIYFDTFGEDYSELHRFFTDYIPGLLDDQGVFGFFNGLGADRRICYDVYTRVVEMHLSDAGLDVAWQDVNVQLAEDGLDKAGKGAWEGILRPYWTLETYRLPTCTFMG